MAKTTIPPFIPLLVAPILLLLSMVFSRFKSYEIMAKQNEYSGCLNHNYHYYLGCGDFLYLFGI